MQAPSRSKPPSPIIPWAWAAAMIAAVVAIGAWLFPAIHNSHYDGGSYLTGAQSLAEGRGYRLVTAIGHPPMPTYPPLQSALLAIPWRLDPHYPSNLGLLRGTMHVVSALALALLFLEWVRKGLPPWLAALGGLAVGSSALWQTLTGFCMAEPLFMLLVGIATAWLHIHAGALEPGTDRIHTRHWLGLGLIAAAMYLARSAAVGVIAGIVFSGIIGGPFRRIPALLAFLLPVAATVAAWSLHPKSPNAGYGAYFASRWEELGGPSGAALLGLTQAWEYASGLAPAAFLSDAWARFPTLNQLRNLGVSKPALVIQSLGALAVTSLAVVGFRRRPQPGDRAVLTIMAIYILQIVAWPFPMGARGAVFLLPWWMRWTWEGWSSLSAVIARPWLRFGLPALALVGVIGSNILLTRLTLNPAMATDARDLQAAGRWIREQVPASAVVGIDGSTSLFDLHHAAGRPLLIGPGGTPPRRYNPAPQDPSLRAQILVVGDDTSWPPTDWTERARFGRYRILARAAPAPNTSN